MQSISNDTTKILTEKLALAREIATLKPELESLRAQVDSNKSLLSEKLALQRQLTTVQVELENAQRSAQRATAKSGKNNDQSEFDFQIEDLQKKLREAKLARREAEGEVEQLKHDLEIEKRLANRTEGKKTRHDGDIADIEDELKSLRKDLSKAKEEATRWKKEAKQLEKEPAAGAQFSESSKSKNDEALIKLKTQLEESRKDLSSEKRERQKAEKALQKEQTAWEAQKSLLDDKLNQFRTKLRSTKERLKETEEQLQQAQSEVISKSSAPAKKSEKSKTAGRKRTATQVDALEIGTPGDEPAAKRGKLAGSVVHALPGDKSTFSITPFLNRTMSIAPETPQEDAQENITEQKDDEQQEETPAKPAAEHKKKTTGGIKMKPLTSAASSKHNAKAIGRKLSSLPSLPEVAEESSELDTNRFKSAEQSKSATETMPATGDPEKKDKPVPKLKASSLKPRKSLMTFTSYTEEPTAEKRKKRKLGASGMPKTLFDEEEDALPVKPIPGRGLFAARAMGKALGVGGGKKGAGNASLLMADNGFQFSPLKKDRRAAGSSTFVE